MSDNSEHTTNVSSVRQEFVLEEISPTIETLLKAYWSTTWRVVLFFLIYILLLFFILEVFTNSPYELNGGFDLNLFHEIASTFFLFWAMRKLNYLHYFQGKDQIKLKISDKAIFFYVFLSLFSTYLIEFIFELVLIDNIYFNVTIFNLFVSFIVGMFIFYRIMTKGIIGFRIVTSRIIPKEISQ